MPKSYKTSIALIGNLPESHVVNLEVTC